MKKTTAYLVIALISFPIMCLHGCGNRELGSPCSSNANCGTDGLCISDWPGGYCTKECSNHQDCGGEGWCYIILNTNQGDMNLCLNGCTGSGECRQGYICDGNSGYTVCSPDSSGGDSYTNADLSGCYARQVDPEMNKYWFDGAINFSEINWNPVSGTVKWGCQYQVSGGPGNGQIRLNYSDGDVKLSSLFISSDKSYIKIDGTNYIEYSAYGTCD